MSTLLLKKLEKVRWYTLEIFMLNYTFIFLFDLLGKTIFIMFNIKGVTSIIFYSEDIIK